MLGDFLLTTLYKSGNSTVRQVCPPAGLCTGPRICASDKITDCKGLHPGWFWKTTFMVFWGGGLFSSPNKSVWKAENLGNATKYQEWMRMICSLSSPTHRLVSAGKALQALWLPIHKCVISHTTWIAAVFFLMRNLLNYKPWIFSYI